MSTPDDNAAQDLGLVQTDDLVDELKRRSEALVILQSPKANPENNVLFNPNGSRHTCIGMAVDFIWGMLNYRDADDDDDD